MMVVGGLGFVRCPGEARGGVAGGGRYDAAQQGGDSANRGGRPSQLLRAWQILVLAMQLLRGRLDLVQRASYSTESIW